MSAPDTISSLLANGLRREAAGALRDKGDAAQYHRLRELADKIDGGAAVVIPFPVPAKLGRAL